MCANLRSVDSFGEVSAEDDTFLLSYFLSTNTVRRVEEGGAFLVLGRKGSGKTAIVRHFTEGQGRSRSRALNLRNYPWNIHALRVDRGADVVDAYVASWRYLVAVEIAAWAIERPGNVFNDHQRPLRDFLTENYGNPRPNLADIIRPRRLRIRGFNLNPQIFGNALGSVDLERDNNDRNLGLELEALTQAILTNAIRVIRECQLGDFYMHFDELDAGLEALDETRKRMIVGLILALRGLKREFREAGAPIKPILYLRTDIWDDLKFSDKNKITQGQAEAIEWDAESLKQMVEERLRAKIEGEVGWDDIIDEQLMRGSQPKWNHIVARTLRRPRDIIQFLNVSLRTAKHRNDEVIVFQNPDIVNSRNDYSGYFKRELDDEILPTGRSGKKRSRRSLPSQQRRSRRKRSKRSTDAGRAKRILFPVRMHFESCTAFL